MTQPEQSNSQQSAWDQRIREYRKRVRKEWDTVGGDESQRVERIAVKLDADPRWVELMLDPDLPGGPNRSRS